jgi:hypothetical protein
MATPDVILAIAEREGVAASIRHGRLSYRGGSPAHRSRCFGAGAGTPRAACHAGRLGIRPWWESWHHP